MPSWSNILASSRAIDWTNAGLPATFPDGETTPNPWTPPTRPQCTSYAGYPNPITGTGVAATDVAAINNALFACTQGSGRNGVYIPITGTFNINDSVGNCYGGTAACIQFYAVNGVTLRGSGPMSTNMVFTGNAQLTFGFQPGGTGSCTWASGFSQGSNSLVMNSCSGTPLVAGELAFLRQCDTGYSGNPCTGTPTDNGGLVVEGAVGSPYSQQTRGDLHQNQVQVVYVNSITGSCSTGCTVNFSPGLYAPNWSSSQTPVVTWIPGQISPTPYGNGLEDMTIDGRASTVNDGVIYMGAGSIYACWVKGVRGIGFGTNYILNSATNKNVLFVNNYFFAYAINSSGDPVFTQQGPVSDNLRINNIVTGALTWNGDGGNQGNVFAYNYGRDSQGEDYAQTGRSYYQLAMYDHEPWSAFNLFEANQTGLFLGDNTWGTQDLSTLFRNNLSGYDPPYITAQLARVVEIANYARFENIVGNVLGGPLITSYQTASTNYVYQFGSADPILEASTLRWGNYDNVTNAVRWCGNSSSPGWATTCGSTSEVPTALSGNAAPFDNPVPSSTALPCSFFLSGYTSTTCTAHPAGGTGLNFWKVVTGWTTFPTVPATTEVAPFPPIGPDVTGGNWNNGYAYDIPAAIAFKNLPIDPAYQNSYTITGSSWSASCLNALGQTYACETLTVSGLPNTEHVMGPFQISGGACSTGAGEVYMTSSNPGAGTISYALASNPGTCTGTVLWPNIRQFDERVYQNDPASSGAVLSPNSANFGSITVGFSSPSITFTLINNSAVTITGISISNVSGANTSFVQQSTTCGTTLAASASCNILMVFTPLTTGSLSTVLTITDSDPSSPQTATLSGIGLVESYGLSSSSSFILNLPTSWKITRY